MSERITVQSCADCRNPGALSDVVCGVQAACGRLDRLSGQVMTAERECLGPSPSPDASSLDALICTAQKTRQFSASLTGVLRQAGAITCGGAANACPRLGYIEDAATQIRQIAAEL